MTGPAPMRPDPNFVDEARENLDRIEESLLAVGGQGIELELIHAIFRYAHSIKGAAAAYGMSGLARLMHQVESLLDQWRRNHAAPDSMGAGLLLEAVVTARRLLSDDAAPDAVQSDLARRLQEMVGSHAPAPCSRQAQIVLKVHDMPGLESVVPELFRDIGGLGEIVARSRGQDESLVYTVNTNAPDIELQDLLAMHVDRSQFDVRASPAPVAVAGNETHPSGVSSNTSSVRVSQAELAEICRIGKSLADAGIRLAGNASLAPTATGVDLSAQASELQRISEQLQQSIRNMRTAPVSAVVEPARRSLQSLSLQLGKQVRLVVAGEDVRVDRLLVQGLTDLVIQLVRNACDHGIESPAERVAVGKGREGVVSLEAAERSGVFRLVVRDDGRGFSRERLLLAAHAGGLDVRDDAPDDEMWQLALVPGVSTADAVSPVSGRGVGMDIVGRKVASWGGTLAIESSPGAGTGIAIELPTAATDRSVGPV